jgi:PKHD-type hydroxylase
MMYLKNLEDTSWEVILDNVLTTAAHKELDIFLKNNPANSTGGTYDVDNIDNSIRKSDISWLLPSKETSNIFHCVASAIQSVNTIKYGFSLTYIEAIQYSEYKDGGHYTWHPDSKISSANGDIRKLSFSLLLNDDYEGGKLELFVGPTPEEISIKRNQMVIFPSHVLHRVTPVLKGQRNALVGWIHGPNFV